MSLDEPAVLSIGTEVSARYKGAFCEAKIKKVNRSIKCKATCRGDSSASSFDEEAIQGTVTHIGQKVFVKKTYGNTVGVVEAIVNKIIDQSQYTVVFDDGDETTLKRTYLFIKSGKHFAESETLDKLPLTNPEHFGNPVSLGRRSRRRPNSSHLSSQSRFKHKVSKTPIKDQTNRSDSDDSEDNSSKCSSLKKRLRKAKLSDPEAGKVVCVDYADKRGSKNKDVWFPALVLPRKFHDATLVNPKPLSDEYRVRSFRDDRYYNVSKKDARTFEKGQIKEQLLQSSDEFSTELRQAIEKAVHFIEFSSLPEHWDSYDDEDDTDEEFTMDESSNSNIPPSTSKVNVKRNLSKKFENEVEPEVEDDDDDDDDDDDSDSDFELNIDEIEDAEEREERLRRQQKQLEERDLFVAKLYEFMDDRGTPINNPTVNGNELNLYKLYRIVTKMGGLNRVTNQNAWRKVFNKLDLGNPDAPPNFVPTDNLNEAVQNDSDEESDSGINPTDSPVSQLKSAYKKYLHPFFDLQRKLGSTSFVDYRSSRNISRPPRGERKREEERSRVNSSSSVSSNLSTPAAANANARKLALVSSKSVKGAASTKENASVSPVVETASVASSSVSAVQSQTSILSNASATSNVTTPISKSAKEKAEDNKKRKKKEIVIKEEDTTEIQPQTKADTENDDSQMTGQSSAIEGESDGEDGNSSSKISKIDEASITIGDGLKVKYGRGRQLKVYEAKVLKVTPDATNRKYFVHYYGWSSRYDEWIQRNRIVHIVRDKSPRRRKRNKGEPLPPEAANDTEEEEPIVYAAPAKARKSSLKGTETIAKEVVETPTKHRSRAASDVGKTDSSNLKGSIKNSNLPEVEKRGRVKTEPSSTLSKNLPSATKSKPTEESTPRRVRAASFSQKESTSARKEKAALKSEDNVKQSAATTANSSNNSGNNKRNNKNSSNNDNANQGKEKPSKTSIKKESVDETVKPIPTTAKEKSVKSEKRPVEPKKEKKIKESSKKNIEKPQSSSTVVDSALSTAESSVTCSPVSKKKRSELANSPLIACKRRSETSATVIDRSSPAVPVTASVTEMASDAYEFVDEEEEPSVNIGKSGTAKNQANKISTAMELPKKDNFVLKSRPPSSDLVSEVKTEKPTKKSTAAATVLASSSPAPPLTAEIVPSNITISTTTTAATTSRVLSASSPHLANLSPTLSLATTSAPLVSSISAEILIEPKISESLPTTVSKRESPAEFKVIVSAQSNEFYSQPEIEAFCSENSNNYSLQTSSEDLEVQKILEHSEQAKDNETIDESKIKSDSVYFADESKDNLDLGIKKAEEMFDDDIDQSPLGPLVVAEDDDDNDDNKNDVKQTVLEQQETPVKLTIDESVVRVDETKQLHSFTSDVISEINLLTSVRVLPPLTSDIIAPIKEDLKSSELSSSVDSLLLCEETVPASPPASPPPITSQAPETATIHHPAPSQSIQSDFFVSQLSAHSNRSVDQRQFQPSTMPNPDMFISPTKASYTTPAFLEKIRSPIPQASLAQHQTLMAANTICNFGSNPIHHHQPFSTLIAAANSQQQPMVVSQPKFVPTNKSTSKSLNVIVPPNIAMNIMKIDTKKMDHIDDDCDDDEDDEIDDGTTGAEADVDEAEAIGDDENDADDEDNIRPESGRKSKNIGRRRRNIRSGSKVSSSNSPIAAGLLSSQESSQDGDDHSIDESTMKMSRDDSSNLDKKSRYHRDIESNKGKSPNKRLCPSGEVDLKNDDDSSSENRGDNENKHFISPAPSPSKKRRRGRMRTVSQSDTRDSFTSGIHSSKERIGCKTRGRYRHGVGLNHIDFFDNNNSPTNTSSFCKHSGSISSADYNPNSSLPSNTTSNASLLSNIKISKPEPIDYSQLLNYEPKSKYNFFAQLDLSLDLEKSIIQFEDALQLMRKTYHYLKEKTVILEQKKKKAYKKLKDRKRKEQRELAKATSTSATPFAGVVNSGSDSSSLSSKNERSSRSKHRLENTDGNGTGSTENTATGDNSTELPMPAEQQVAPTET